MFRLAIFLCLTGTPAMAQTAQDAIEFIKIGLKTCGDGKQVTAIDFTPGLHRITITLANSVSAEVVSTHSFLLTEVDFSLGDRYWKLGSESDDGRFQLKVDCVVPGCFSYKLTVLGKTSDGLQNFGIYACDKDLIPRLSKALATYQKVHGKLKPKF